MRWPKHPLIYEINTWVWLNELSRKYGRAIKLDTVPSGEWDALARFGMDAVWLMGVWERSPAGLAIAVENEGLQADFRRALPDLQPEDIAGSPYCVRRYTVDEHLGGADGLAVARAKLAKRSIRLVLDFVPNHVSPDHPWVTEHPDYFVAGNDNDLKKDREAFFRLGRNIYARGRDPYFPAWPDVVQLNAFNSGLREGAIQTLRDIASQADGVRCDMAMLLLNKVFANTWGNRVGIPPAEEYWDVVIQNVKARFPDCSFMAEAYWDMEWDLQQLGFDYCYDKRLYDRIRHESPESVRLHLCADLNYQRKLIRFIENHDEPRAAAVFSPESHRAAAVLTMTLPGAKLLHEGQMEGYRTRLPVFLSRRPEEPSDDSLRTFYLQLLGILDDDTMRNGSWSLCECTGWEDNSSCRNLIASSWTGQDGRRLIITNLSDKPAQARVTLPWEDLRGTACQFQDLFSGQSYERDGNEILAQGLYVDLAGWAFHCFALQIPEPRSARTGVPDLAGNRAPAARVKRKKEGRESRLHADQLNPA